MKNPLKIRWNSLYPGIPPFIWYVYYLGEPLYKVGRKIGLPKVGALALANVPGSLFHVYKDILNGDFGEAALLFGVSELIFTGLFYGIHKFHYLKRKKKNNFRADISKIVESASNDICP